MSKNNRKYREEKKEWRHFFTDAQLKTAERYVNNGKVRDFEENGLAAAARVTGKSVYYPVIQGAPTCYSEDWDEEYQDRMNKIVFIGKDMDKEEIIKKLDSFLDL